MKTVRIKDYYGNVHYVPVSDEVYEGWCDLRRAEDRLRKRESYHRHKLTIDKYEAGARVCEDDPIQEELIRQEEITRLYHAISKLTPIQRRRILMLLEDMNCNQIAEKEGRHPSVIYRSVEKSFRHLRKLLSD